MCSYIHLVGDFERVIGDIACRLETSTDDIIADYIYQMNYWAEKADRLIANNNLNQYTAIEWITMYRDIGYWTTVVPLFLTEALHLVQISGKYKSLAQLCEKLRSESRYPYFNEYIINPLLFNAIRDN